MSSRIVGTWTEWGGEKLVTRGVHEDELFPLNLPPYGQAEYEADRKRLAEFVEQYGGWPTTLASPPPSTGER